MGTYTTVSKVASYLGEVIDATTTPSSSDVETFITRAEAEVDEITGTSFSTQTATAELYDYDKYAVFVKEPQLSQVGRVDHIYSPIRNVVQLNNRPLISVTSLEVNQGTVESPDWKSLTENTDFIKYCDEAVIALVRADALPVENYQSIKVTYTYGYASVPPLVEKLTTLLVVKEVLRLKQMNSSYNSMDSISIETISISKSTSESVKLLRDVQDEIDKTIALVGNTNFWVV